MLTGARLAAIVASALVAAVTVGMLVAATGAWRNTERDFTQGPFETELCDVQRSETPPEDPELFWINVAGVYSYGFEARHRGCVIHQGDFVERQRAGGGTYRDCNFASSSSSGGSKTPSGGTVRGMGTSSDTGTCRVVLTNIIVED